MTNAAVPMMSRTHGQTGQPDHAGQGNRQRGGALQRAAQRIADVEILGKMNGAVGNYNAHLSAYPELDWQAFSKT